MKTSCSTFKNQIERILAKHNLLEDFKTKEDFHRKFENDGFQPLVIERHGNRVMVTHYFEQNGDLIPDPDMELMIGCDGEWYPVAIQFATGHYAQARYWDERQRIYQPARNPRSD